MKQITVLGVGALGSHVVQFLRNEAAELHIVDFDRVEQKNVQSQFHGKPHVGKLKVHSLQQTMQFLYGTKLTAVPHRLTADNIGEIAGHPVTEPDDRHDYVMVDCLDNAKSRRLVQAFSEQGDVPCVHGALAAGDNLFGRVVWGEQFVPDEEAGAGAATCTNGEQLPFIALVSACLARAVQHFLTTGQQRGYAITPTGVIAI